MSGDVRNDILSRILALAQGVTGIEVATRNRGLLSNEKRPAIVLLDGDETPRLSVDTRRIKGRAALMAPQIVQMRPELYILPKEARPAALNTSPTNVGDTVNGYRIAFLKAMWADVTLADLIGSNGSIVYNGMATDLKSGSALSGELRLDFIINYVLRPTA